MKKLLVAMLLALALMAPGVLALAATTADVTVTATPAFVGISVSPTSQAYGVIASSARPSTITTYFTITNSSTVQTDQTISVTTTTWSGGVTWAHSETATPGADTAGLKANKGGTWGTGDVIVKNGTPNDIATDQAATTNYQFGLKLWAPTSFGDGVEKSITVRVTAAAG